MVEQKVMDVRSLIADVRFDFDEVMPLMEEEEEIAFLQKAGFLRL